MIGIGNRLQMPPVIKNLLIINGILFLCAQFFSGVQYNGRWYEYTGPIYEYLALGKVIISTYYEDLSKLNWKLI